MLINHHILIFFLQKNNYKINNKLNKKYFITMKMIKKLKKYYLLMQINLKIKQKEN